MAVDLHTHSAMSDGSDDPGELVAAAAAAGLSAFALTDHDTAEGLQHAEVVADQKGIELIRGTEISCEWEPGAMHLVVLFLDSSPGPLQNRLPDLQSGRNGRNQIIVERLRSLDIDITLEEVAAEAGDGSVGRPHFAAVLQRKGVVADIPDAFDRFLAKGRPAYAERFRLEPEEAIGLASASGAVPVLAHPHTLGLDTADEFADAFSRLKAAGLVGLECFYAEYTAEERARLADVAERFGLLPSGGSDFHGAYKEGLFLGTGRGDLVVPDSVLEDLRAARPVTHAESA